MSTNEAIRHGLERSFSINLLKLNELIDAGLGDDAVADAVRDDMDSDWKRMDEIQRRRMGFLFQQYRNRSGPVTDIVLFNVRQFRHRAPESLNKK